MNESLQELIEEDLTITEISEKLNIPRTTIQYRIKKLKLQTKLSKSGGECVVCVGELSGKQQMFCSYKCKMKYHRKTINSNLIEKRRDRKIKLVEIKGGECITCGYSKCIAALHFHHRDPKLKSFELGCNTILNYSFETVIEEIDKCDLVCANCHAEIHYG